MDSECELRLTLGVIKIKSGCFLFWTKPNEAWGNAHSIMMRETTTENVERNRGLP